MMDFPTDFGKRFRELRLQAGLTGAALAKPRYSVSYVSQIEAGRRTPANDALEFFAGRLGVSAGFLSTGIPDDVATRLRYRLEEAHQLIRTGKPEEAHRELRQVRTEAEGYGLERVRSQALAAIGEALVAEGRLREAIDAYEEALDGDLPERDRGATVARLATAYRSGGDLPYAAELIESFLNRADRGPLDPGVATDLHSILVSVYFEQGSVARAERAAQRALAAADEQIPTATRARAYWNASRVLAETSQWDEALDLATRARVLMEEVDDRRNVARLHNAYAFICLEVEPPMLEEADEHLAAAEDLLSGASAPGDLAYVFTERSRLALLKKSPEEALAHAERALSHATLDTTETARGLFLKGRALAELGRTKEARLAFKDSASQFEKLGARQQQAASWRELGELELAEGDMPSAVESFRMGLEALDPRRSRA